MSESSTVVDVTNMSENVAVLPSCANPSDEDGFDQYETELNEYLEHLVDLYLDQLILYNRGIVGSLDFMPESMHNVYHSNLYYMSWFYEDVYHNERWEDDYDSWWADRLILDIFEYEYAEYL